MGAAIAPKPQVGTAGIDLPLLALFAAVFMRRDSIFAGFGTLMASGSLKRKLNIKCSVPAIIWPVI